MANPKDKLIYSLLAVCFLAGSVSVSATESVSPERQVEMLIKALTFDRKLHSRVSDSLTVGVVYSGPRADCDEVIKAFNADGIDATLGLPVKAVAIEFSSVESLLKQVKSLGLDNLFIHSSAQRSVTSILQVSRSRNVPSFGDSIDMIEQGVSIGVCKVNGKPKLSINLRASKAEGMDLSVQLLKLAQVIK